MSCTIQQRKERLNKSTLANSNCTGINLLLKIVTTTIFSNTYMHAWLYRLSYCGGCEYRGSTNNSPEVCSAARFSVIDHNYRAAKCSYQVVLLTTSFSSYLLMPVATNRAQSVSQALSQRHTNSVLDGVVNRPRHNILPPLR